MTAADRSAHEDAGLDVAHRLAEVRARAAAACRRAGRGADEVRLIGVAKTVDLERIRAAAAAGDEWVVLFETGRSELAPFSPFRRLEMRISDGRGLHASIVSDPSTGGPAFTVEVVQLDPATGDWVNDAEPLAASTSYPTRQEWDDAIGALRRGKLPPARP